MTDIATTFDQESLAGDLEFDGALLAQDEGLDTAILHSLFTNARAKDGDELPAGTASRQGWWGDLTLPHEGDRYGSRLYLLSREKQTPAVLLRAEEYAREALAWLTADGLADHLEVTAEIVREGVLGLKISVWLDDEHPIVKNYLYDLSGGGSAL